MQNHREAVTRWQGYLLESVITVAGLLHERAHLGNVTPSTRQN